jgi:hypothetical protein
LNDDLLCEPRTNGEINMSDEDKDKKQELTDGDLDNVSGGDPGTEVQDLAGSHVGKMLFEASISKTSANVAKKKAAEAEAASANLGGEHGVCPGAGSGVGPS